ncbi:speE, partial [Symbiodinium sp. CCMP2456]
MGRTGLLRLLVGLRLTYPLAGWTGRSDGTGNVSGVVIHDPDDLLGRSAWSQDAGKLSSLLQSFETSMGSEHLGQFAVHAGVAFVDSDGLPRVTADHLAQELGFNGAEPGVLVALSAVSVYLAGSLLQADLPGGEEHLLESEAWLSAEALCRALLRSGDYISAAEAALRGLLQALTHSVESIAPHGNFKQKELDKWESEYQVGEVWLNMCGEKVCRELVLGDVRQLSDGFERYYHEALVYPALNLLGGQKRKVLILGGGDGGVATAALRFDTVEQIVNVDIDSFVTQAAAKWFPKVAAGLNDSRCEMLHLDAFSWVEEQYNSGRSTFDLVVIDFTDEPVKGAWSKKFFSEVRGLLTNDGIVVQNVGTIANPEDMRKLYGLHADVFPAVFPLHAMIPDYLGPYMLVLSSAKPLDPAAVNWDHWQRQQILGQYYGGAAQHHALFRHIPADVSRLLGLSLSLDEKAPSSVVRPLPFFKRGASGNEKVVVKVKGIDGSKVQVSTEGNSLSFYQDRDLLLDAKSLERDEVLVLPALAVLGSRAQSVLVLGGGTAGVAALALKWPTVEKIVVVEVDEVVLKVVRKHFPKQAEVLSDPRVELVLEDVFVWLTQDKRSFDLVVVNMLDQPWLPPRRTTRLPRTKAFFRLLMAKVASGGCLTQEAGSAAMPEQFGSMLSIHRSIFVSTWPMAMSSSSPQPAVPGDEFDGIYFRLPRLFLLSTVNVLSPLQASWELWQGFVDSGTVTTYYHPQMHVSLFTLPAEMQRRFDVPAPAIAAEDTEEPPSSHLVHTFMSEASGCSPDLLNDIPVTGRLLRRLATLGDLTVLGHLEHKFHPQGVTALLLVSESHLSIHTWPERGYAVVDVVSCKALQLITRNAMEME